MQRRCWTRAGADVDRRAAAGTFADFLLARAETLGFGIGEERIGFHEIAGHPDNAAEESVRICLAALNLHERVFPFSHHFGRRDLFRQDADEGWCRVTGLYTPKKPQLYDAVIRLDDSGGKYVSFKMEFDR